MATRGLNDLPAPQILPAPGGRRLTESELDFNDPLVLAVEQGLRDEVYTLLAAGVGVHHIDARRKPFFPEWNGEMVRGGPTLLMLAMRRGHDDVAELLIESSADPTLSDHFGKTAVMMAMEFGHGDIPSVKRLISASLRDQPALDTWGHSEVHYAAAWGVVDAMELMNSQPETAADQQVFVADEEDPDEMLDVLSLAVKHEQSGVVELLVSMPASSATSTNPGMPSPAENQRRRKMALILACRLNKWSDELAASITYALDEPDEYGLTPLMWALCAGSDKVARELLARHADPTRVVSAPPSSKEDGLRRSSSRSYRGSAFEADDARARDLASSLVGKPMLLVAIESNAELETIKELIRAGAPAALPSLDQTLHDASGRPLLLELQSTGHPIGLALVRATHANDAELIAAHYSMARSMLASAFCEKPGAALCASVAIAKSMERHALKMELEDALDFADQLKLGARQVRTSVGALLSTLPAAQRQKLLLSVAGTNFMNIALSTGCEQMLYSQEIEAHLKQRWDGELLFAIRTGSATYRWGGKIRISRTKRMVLAALAIFVVIPLNLFIVLPLVSIAPSLANGFLDALDVFGEAGIDHGGRRSVDSCTSGYSAHLTLWWRSLYLINVPGFKYYTALIGIIAMIVLMLSLDECFGAATQLQCFDMISKSPANPFAGWFDFASGPFLQESSSGPVDTVDVSSGTFERDFSESQQSHRSKALYALFFVYPVAILPGIIRSGGSMASAHSLITAVAATLMLGYNTLGVLAFLGSSERFEIESTLLGVAVGLLSLDVCRGILLSTYSTGPVLMMVFRMMYDVAMFGLIAVAISISFTLGLYLYNTSTSWSESVTSYATTMDTATRSDECHFREGDFGSYVSTMHSKLLGFDGVSDQISCLRESSLVGQAGILAVYLLIVTILLINMLMASLVDTFFSRRPEMEEKYKGLSAQMVVLADVAQGDIPVPLNILRVPSVIIDRLVALRFSQDDNTAYSTIDNNSSVKAAFSNVNAAVLMERMEELEGDRTSSDILPLSELRKEIVASNDRRATELALHDIKVYQSYREAVHLLLFHYGANFGHLSKRPELRSVPIAAGSHSGEPVQLPTLPEHEDKGSEAKLSTRALASHARPLDVTDVVRGESVLAEMGDTFVYKRANGSIGVTMPWCVDYDEQFQREFECSYMNPDPNHFQVQAIVEFERTIRKLFGRDALKRGTVVFAKQTRENDGPVFVGPAVALAKYLQAHPETVEAMSIAKLLPDGFMAIRLSYDEEEMRHDFIKVSWPRDGTCALYIRLGQDVHATVVPLEDFQRDCTLDHEINAADVWNPPGA